MTWHESYWVVVGTAGPVLLLAHVLNARQVFTSLTDVVALRGRRRGRVRQPDRLVYIGLGVVALLGLGGCVFTAAATISALASLGTEADHHLGVADSEIQFSMGFLIGGVGIEGLIRARVRRLRMDVDLPT